MFKIDQEFKSLIPQLSVEEYSQLEENILSDGCRDPLTVWQEQDLLLDGHNRFDICVEHGVEYELHYVSLSDRPAAINWIIDNQLGRRNLNPTQSSALRGRRYNLQKKEIGENQHTIRGGQNDHPTKTAEKLARDYGVSEKTIRRDGKFDEAIETISTTVGEAARAAILSGDSKLTKQDVVDAAEYFKSKPTIEQRAEDLAGDEDAYDWVDERSCTDCAFFQSNYPDNWCTELGRKLGTEDVIMLCNGDKWQDQYAPKAPEPEVFVARTEKEILEAAKRIRQAKLDVRRTERVERINEIAKGNAPLNDTAGKLYPVIYADPPWRYEHSQTDNRQIENHYPTMSLDDICELPVSDIAANDAVLILWTTSPKLAESLSVVESWGFTYRTCMVWDKDRIGMGYYARQQHELLLIATRGELPTPKPESRPGSVVRIKRDPEHSVKPVEFYDIIERMYPEYSKVELFARNEREGWDRWGNQA